MNEKIGGEMRARESRPATPNVEVIHKVKVVERAPRWMLLAILLLLGLLAGASFFAWDFYAKAQSASAPIPTDDKMVVVQNIAKHVLLPTGEEPVFATVTDPAKLADQPFFAQAQTGDKVLVFTKAQRAILYRPSTDRIIEMMPIDLGATAF